MMQSYRAVTKAPTESLALSFNHSSTVTTSANTIRALRNNEVRPIRTHRRNSRRSWRVSIRSRPTSCLAASFRLRGSRVRDARKLGLAGDLAVGEPEHQLRDTCIGEPRQHREPPVQ